MAESGLSISYPDLQAEVGQFLGVGRTPGNFGADDDSLIDAIIQSGVRRVYYPQAAKGIEEGYEWSFLRPSSTLYLGADGTDGSVSTTTFDSATHTDWTTYGIVAGTDEVTISAGTGPTLDDYAISLVTAGTLTLSSAPGDGTSLTFFVTRATANYDLPDSFNRVIGLFHHAADQHLPPVEIVTESSILQFRAHGDYTGAPRFAAVREKSCTGSTGQRREVLFYPRPDKAYVMTYSFEAYSGALTDELPYPLGGMHMSELYIESCLAVAEQRVTEEAGLHTRLFEALLADRIARDRKRGGMNFGNVGDVEDLEDSRRIFRRGYIGSTYEITYNGESV